MAKREHLLKVCRAIIDNPLRIDGDAEFRADAVAAFKSAALRYAGDREALKNLYQNEGEVGVAVVNFTGSVAPLLRALGLPAATLILLRLEGANVGPRVPTFFVDWEHRVFYARSRPLLPQAVLLLVGPAACKQL